MFGGLDPLCPLNHVISGHLGRTSLEVLVILPRDALAVSYTTCWTFVQHGVLLSSHDWASALSVSCTRLSAWLLFLNVFVFSLTSFIAPFYLCFSPYTVDYPRSQHVVVSPTVCSTYCSCATNINLIPASTDDEVYHIPVSRAGMRPGGLVCILLFEHGVVHYQIKLSA